MLVVPANISNRSADSSQHTQHGQRMHSHEPAALLRAPAASPARLLEIWGSVMVAMPTPRHTTSTEAVTRGDAFRP